MNARLASCRVEPWMTVELQTVHQHFCPWKRHPPRSVLERQDDLGWYGESDVVAAAHGIEENVDVAGDVDAL